METLSYFDYCMSNFQYNLSRVLALPNPEVRHHHALQFNLICRHFLSTASNTRLEVSPPSTGCLTVIIPPSCLRDPYAAFTFVRQVSRRLPVPLGLPHVRILVSSIVGLASGMWVVASMEIHRIDTFVGGDVLMPNSVMNSVVDDTVIFDAGESRGASGSVSSDASNKKIMLKEMTFDRASYGDRTSCSICLDEFEQGCRVTSTPCSHLYHGDCIDKWTRRKTSCPLCRSELFA